jgi:hypothetical protein
MLSANQKSTFILIILLCTMSCSGTKQNSQDQGILGQVLWFEGNQMPGFDREPDPGKGIAREIHIYELTKQSQASASDMFFDKIQTKRIAIAKSDDEGFFNISLAPGSYSVFVKEESGLFANLFDGDNHIYPVVVEAGKYNELVISVNYQAAY